MLCGGQGERRRAFVCNFDGDTAHVKVVFKNVWTRVDRHHMQFICNSIPLEELKVGVTYIVMYMSGNDMASKHLQFLDIHETPTTLKMVRFTEFDLPFRWVIGVMVGDAPSKTNKRKLMCPCCSEDLMFDGIKLHT